MILFSFFLEGLLSNYIVFPFFFTLTSIIFSSLYYSEHNVMKYSFLIGILYDLVYTNTIILNGFLFFVLSSFISYMNKHYKKKFLYFAGLNILVHFLYEIVTYAILGIFRYLNVDIIFFLKTFFISTIIDFLYFGLLYFLYHKIKRHT